MLNTTDLLLLENQLYVRTNFSSSFWGERLPNRNRLNYQQGRFSSGGINRICHQQSRIFDCGDSPASKSLNPKLEAQIAEAKKKANAAQLALLKIIDNKLGVQLPGGLSATFGRLWQMLQVDIIIRVLTYITVVHNALMLSNNIFQTLFSAFDNIAQFAGFKWKNEKGDEIGFGGLINEWISNSLKVVFGEDTIKNASQVWNAANRIYQAAANIAGLVQSIQQSILTALEVIGAGVGKIANALKACGF